MNSENYADAAEQFSSVIGNSSYEDAKELYRECSYKGGLAALDSKDYKKAITLLNAAKSDDRYPDANAKINEAKYLYVLGHKSRTDSSTYQYLKDLKNIGYSDTASIYNSLYQWKFDIYAVNNSKTSTSNMSTISRRDTIYFHFKVEGGIPSGGSMKVRFVGYLPNTNGTSSDYYEVYSGEDSWHSLYYTDSGATGTARGSFYDANGNLLDSATVYIN